MPDIASISLVSCHREQVSTCYAGGGGIFQEGPIGHPTHIVQVQVTFVHPLLTSGGQADASLLAA